MDVGQFGDESPGRIVPISGYDASRNRYFKHFAYIPNPLPDEPVLAPATYGEAARADSAVARLDALTTRLTNPSLLQQPALMREALSTSALEGTFAPARDVLAADLADESSRSQDEREILNAARATELGLSLITAKPICLTVINELHATLLRGTRSDGTQSGQLRTTPVYIGGSRDGIERSRFVPVPPGEALIGGYDAWEKWINNRTELPLAVRVALGHYQFETLHPYNDGNGRLGRLIMMLQYVVAGELTHPVLNLSPWLDARKNEYRDGLLRLSIDGRFDSWVTFMCRCVIESSNDAIQRIERLMAFRDELKARLHAVGARGVVWRLAEDIPGLPVLTPSQVAGRYGVTYPPAAAAIDKLVSMGVLREITGQRYGKVFLCQEVFSILGFE